MAMVVAAMITIVPVMLAVIGFMIGIVWLIFLR